MPSASANIKKIAENKYEVTIKNRKNNTINLTNQNSNTENQNGNAQEEANEVIKPGTNTGPRRGLRIRNPQQTGGRFNTLTTGATQELSSIQSAGKRTKKFRNMRKTRRTYKTRKN